MGRVNKTVSRFGNRRCCPACTGYGRAYLHHLVKADEILGAMLLSWHNLRHFQLLMAAMRSAIAERRFDAFAAGFAAAAARGDIDPVRG